MKNDYPEDLTEKYFKIKFEKEKKRLEQKRIAHQRANPRFNKKSPKKNFRRKK